MSAVVSVILASFQLSHHYYHQLQQCFTVAIAKGRPFCLILKPPFFVNPSAEKCLALSCRCNRENTVSEVLPTALVAVLFFSATASTSLWTLLTCQSCAHNRHSCASLILATSSTTTNWPDLIFCPAQLQLLQLPLQLARPLPSLYHKLNPFF